MIQIDYVIAAAFFIIFFAISIMVVNDYFILKEKNVNDITIKESAFSIMDHIQKKGTNISLITTAYKFYILANNTKKYYINQSENLKPLPDEAIIFNMSAIASKYDKNSLYIHNKEYQINNSIYTFTSSFEINQSRLFTVWFDDDSNFSDISTSVQENDTITETITPPQEITLIQYERIKQLNKTNYTKLRKDITSEFQISIANHTYGPPVPRKQDVFAMQNYVLYQNKTGGIEEGDLVIKTW